MTTITRKLIFSLLLVLPACANEVSEESHWAALHACGLDDGSVKKHARLGACDPDETKKTTICHVPPGNPANAHTLCIGTPAVSHHLKNHDDYLGPCRVETPCPPAADGGAGAGGAAGGAGAGGAAGSVGAAGAGGGGGTGGTIE